VITFVFTSIYKSLFNFPDPRYTNGGMVLIINYLCLSLTYIYCRHIIKTEGLKSLFRGLGPNLVGVAPSRYYSHVWFNPAEFGLFEQFLL
jgi:hypothetical protein